MNTPLQNCVESALRLINAEHLSRYYNDAPNYTGPRSVSRAEGVEMLLKHCAPFILDWRRLLDEVPAVGQAILIAGRDEDGESVVGEGSLEQLPSRQAFFWVGGVEAQGVYAWAPLPPALDLATINSPLAR